MSRVQDRKALRNLQKTDEQLGKIAGQLSDLADLLCDSPGHAKVSADEWPTHTDLTELLARRRAQQREMTRWWKSLTADEQATLRPKLGAYAPKRATRGK